MLFFCVVTTPQALYRKIYFASPNFPGQVTLEELRSYRSRLLGRGSTLTNDEREELATVTRWIMGIACHYSDLDAEEDPGERVFDQFLSSLLPAIDAVIPTPPFYVCLHHTLIVLGLQRPRPFMDWMKWLNEMRAQRGMPEVLPGTAKNNVSKYLSDHTLPIWKQADYLANEGKWGTKAVNHFKRHVEVCRQLQEVIVSNAPIAESLT